MLVYLAPHHRLFLKAYRHNWDQGVAALSKIVKDPECDLATAKLIYWLGKPAFYNEYDDVADIPKHARTVHTLIRGIEQRVLAGEFESLIEFDPGRFERIPDELGKIPPAMVEATTGDVGAFDLIHRQVGELRIISEIHHSRFDEVRELLAAGLDVNGTYDGSTPIQVAVSSGKLAIVRLLADRGAKLTGSTKGEGLTLLQHAAHGRHQRTVDELLDRGLKVNVRGRWKRTALHSAAESDFDGSMILFLLERGADPTLVDVDGQTPLDRALDHDNHEAAALLSAAMS